VTLSLAPDNSLEPYLTWAGHWYLTSKTSRLALTSVERPPPPGRSARLSNCHNPPQANVRMPFRHLPGCGRWGVFHATHWRQNATLTLITSSQSSLATLGGLKNISIKRENCRRAREIGTRRGEPCRSTTWCSRNYRHRTVEEPAVLAVARAGAEAHNALNGRKSHY